MTDPTRPTKTFYAVDLEMNQPSGTIIEIGVASIPSKPRKATLNKKGLYVSTKEQISPEITELTQISDHTLKTYGVPLAYALQWFWETLEPNPTIFVWGDDMKRIVSASEESGVPVPSKMNIIDLRPTLRLLRLSYPSSQRSGGLKKSLETLGMEFDGQQHQAADDAANTLALRMRIVRGWSDLVAFEKVVSDRD